MSYVTVYTRQIRRRKTGRVETIGCAYETKSLTKMHFHIKAAHPDAQTWKDPVRVITEFIQGMNLGMMPIVRGGERVA